MPPSTPTLLIRADATPELGIGHVMRMLAQAQAWRDRGGRVELLGQVDSPALRDRLTGEDVFLRPLEAIHPHPCDLETLVLAANESGAADGGWIALDSYALGPTYQAFARRTGARVLVMDDMAHQPRYEADLLLNQNLGAELLTYNAPGARLLLGPRFAMLRREFRHAEAPERLVRSARRILVSAGGADPVGLSALLVQALALTGRSDFEARIVCGPANPLREELDRLAQALPFPATVICPGADMPEQMAWADFALTAAGSTCWELARMGVPMITFVIAANQRGVLAGLVAQGLAVDGGRVEQLLPQELAARICAFADDKNLLERLSARGRGTIDGQGALRVAEAMSPTKLHFRPATTDDCDWIFRLTNDPQVRAAAFITGAIALATHRQWFQDHLADENCRLLVVQNQYGTPVGQVRLDRRDGETVISVSLTREYRGLGLGSVLLRQAAERGQAEFHLPVLAQVRSENARSLRAFTKAGFRDAGGTLVNGVSARRLIHEDGAT